MSYEQVQFNIEKMNKKFALAKEQSKNGVVDVSIDKLLVQAYGSGYDVNINQEDLDFTPETLEKVRRTGWKNRCVPAIEEGKDAVKRLEKFMAKERRECDFGIPKEFGLIGEIRALSGIEGASYEAFGTTKAKVDKAEKTARINLLNLWGKTLIKGHVNEEDTRLRAWKYFLHKKDLLLKLELWKLKENDLDFTIAELDAAVKEHTERDCKEVIQKVVQTTRHYDTNLDIIQKQAKKLKDVGSSLEDIKMAKAVTDLVAEHYKPEIRKFLSNIRAAIKEDSVKHFLEKELTKYELFWGDRDPKEVGSSPEEIAMFRAKRDELNDGIQKAS